jgi:hypothetical protein
MAGTILRANRCTKDARSHHIPKSFSTNSIPAVRTASVCLAHLSDLVHASWLGNDLAGVNLEKVVADKESIVCLSVILADGYQHSFLFDLCCYRILSLVYEDGPAMPGKRAKILSAADVADLLVFASCTRHPLRNKVMVLLSAKAGLRAGEIANLTWDMVVDANGQISGLIELADTAAKKCSGRSIPVHPDLAAALAAWQQVAPRPLIM